MAIPRRQPCESLRRLGDLVWNGFWPTAALFGANFARVNQLGRQKREALSIGGQIDLCARYRGFAFDRNWAT